MATVFNITTASNTVRLDGQQRGEVAFTVSNTSGRPLRGRAKLVPLDSTPKSWLTIAGESERDFPAGGVQQFTVQVAVPSESKEGRYVFRLDAVAVQNPDEDYTQGPAIAFVLAKQEKAKRFPWWIPALAVLVIAALGVGFWLFERGKVEVPSIIGKNLVDANTALAPLNLKIGNVTNVLTDAASIDKVLSQSPSAGEKAASGSAVDVQVGVAIVTVPTVVGKSYNDAVSGLHAAVLDVGQVSNANSPGVLTPGLVLDSNPKAGNSVKSHSTVDLVVQDQNVPVPNVVGQPFQTAVASLTAAKLKLGTVTGDIYRVVAGAPGLPGLMRVEPMAAVADQNPKTGSVPIGSAVNLVFPNPGIRVNPALVRQQATQTSHW
ncbi:MAG TPA: PASTA domain-containing protein [Terriglobia bacterium]|nr:PASTA domain-containing protein [Terriglobia bacterium]